MDKKFCDRCGKEIKPRKILRRGWDHETFLEAHFDMWGLSARKFELCYECYCELKKFMKDPSTYHLDYRGEKEE